MEFQLVIIFFCLAVCDGTGQSIGGEHVKCPTPPPINPDPIHDTVLRKKRSSEKKTIATIKPWPNNTIPYVMAANFDNDGQEMIQNTMEYIRAVTPFRFVPRTAENIYIRITSNDNNCHSGVGYTGQSYDVNLAKPTCMHKWTILHQLLNVIGLRNDLDEADKDHNIEHDGPKISAGYRLDAPKIV